LSALAPVIHELSCEIEWPLECAEALVEWQSCMWGFGCIPFDCSGRSGGGPNGEHTCECLAVCYDSRYHYESKCWTTGTTSSCDCLINDILVGTCEGGAEPFCSANLWEGCCNQFFNL
jgi:hypothetical protein